MMIALVARLSGLRAIVERCGHLLGTTNYSSLSPALSRETFRAYVQRLVGVLECRHRPGRGDLVAIDGMAVTLPKTQRHHCKKVNNKTVGGGVVWAYMLNAVKGACPVQILKVVRGAWHDTTVMREVALIANGPTYLMDRGFYCFELLQMWRQQHVHFIVRCKAHQFYYEPLSVRRPARKSGALQILFDGVAQLGGPKAKIRPVVRLVVAQMTSGESLILASDQERWSAEAILAAYKKRWHIERFHRFLKDTLGLAHLYNFDQNGIEFLLHTALLTALLLFMSETNPSGETIALLRRVLRAARRALGLGTPWKRNTFAVRRSKGSAKKKRSKNL
jgi:hypothetical protein